MKLLKTIQLNPNAEDKFDTNDYDLFMAMKPYTDNEVRLRVEFLKNHEDKPTVNVREKLRRERELKLSFIETICLTSGPTEMEIYVKEGLDKLGVMKIGNPFHENSTLETPLHFIKWFTKENKIEIYKK
jgi:hypothetical protein